jgi:hypothetical protein
MYNHSPPNTAYNFHRTVLSDGLPRLFSHIKYVEEY